VSINHPILNQAVEHLDQALAQISNNHPVLGQALEHIADAVLAKLAPVPAAPSILSFIPDAGPAPNGTSDVHTIARSGTLTGSGAANTSVSVFDGHTLVGTTTVDANGGWSLKDSSLALSTHTFTATDTNAHGTSQPSAAFDVTVDNPVNHVVFGFSSAVSIDFESSTLTSTTAETLTPPADILIFSPSQILANESAVVDTTFGNRGTIDPAQITFTPGDQTVPASESVLIETDTGHVAIVGNFSGNSFDFAWLT
jgi:Bacterial Ig-like domain